MKALIIEDDHIQATLLRKVVERLGAAEVFVESRAEDALVLLTRQAVDVVLVDWNLPGMSGLEVVKRIRATTALRELPVLMVTGNSQAVHLMAAVEAGITDYVVKPVSNAVLRQKVENALKQAA